MRKLAVFSLSYRLLDKKSYAIPFPKRMKRKYVSGLWDGLQKKWVNFFFKCYLRAVEEFFKPFNFLPTRSNRVFSLGCSKPMPIFERGPIAQILCPNLGNTVVFQNVSFKAKLSYFL